MSRRASMHTSCAMMSSRVTPLVEEEGADVDGAIAAGGITILNCLERSGTLLRLTVAASMAPITWKWSEMGKGTEKWHRILEIAEGKMRLSWVAESLNTSMIERIKWEGKSIVKCSKRENKNQARGSVRNLGPLAKVEQEVNWCSPQLEGCSQKEEISSSSDTILRQSQLG